MAYQTNPFLERMSERTTSDQEFVRLFSPKILERLEDDSFLGAVHVFRSPPGGGKTTLLRAFTPTALRAFWNARRVQELNESYQRLVARQILDEQDGPQLLGVLLSCASGYADLPPGTSLVQEGLFRALLDCRIVLRSLRSLLSLLGLGSADDLAGIHLHYDSTAADLKSIPLTASARDLLNWAEQRERTVYAQLDAIAEQASKNLPTQVRFEGVLWLQSVQFQFGGRLVAPKRMLMIDDLHKLRRKQRTLLLEELTEARPSLPVWLAERSVALGDELLSQGSRDGRDIREYSLEKLWSSSRGHHQFETFAKNILDRRLEAQGQIPPGAFSQYLRDEFQSNECIAEVEKGLAQIATEMERYRSTPRYGEWIRVFERATQPTIESLRSAVVIRILLARDELNRQMTLQLEPLSPQELTERDSSQVQAAADVFLHEEYKIPYYFGIDRLCVLATNNIEELLGLAAALYDGLKAKLALRRPELILSPAEQERLLRDTAKRKRDFIPKNHTEGTKAQRLLDAIGSFCRDRTFLPNAPIAPGVTGVRLSHGELDKLNSGQLMKAGELLRSVLSECVAENLLLTHPSAASTSRPSGTVFYLNRTLCAHYGLPLQMSGWQETSCDELMDWMERGRIGSRQKSFDRS